MSGRFVAVVPELRDHLFRKAGACLGVGYQALAVDDKFFEKPLRIVFVWVSGTDQVHWHIGVDEDHASLTGIALIPLFDFRQHLIDIGGRKRMPGGSADNLELLATVNFRLLTPRRSS